MRKTAAYPQKRPGDPGWFNRWIQSPRWLLGFGICVGVCLVLYSINAIFGRLHPASAWGLTYGILATVIYIAVLMYSLRRRVIRVPRIQRAWHYLQLHVYGGTIFLILVFMHTNFQLPQGGLAWFLWGLALWIVLSGFAGSALQKWIPNLLHTGLSTEVNYARIPELLDDLKTRAQSILGSTSEDVVNFYQRAVGSTMEHTQPRWSYLINPAGAIQERLNPFSKVQKYLSDAEQAHLASLETIVRAKLELDAHFTLQRLLRVWLALHIPVAVILLLLILIHILVVLYY